MYLIPNGQTASLLRLFATIGDTAEASQLGRVTQMRKNVAWTRTRKQSQANGSKNVKTYSARSLNISRPKEEHCFFHVAA